MSWLKLLLTALVTVLAVVGSLLAAAVVAVVGLVVLLTRRWLGFSSGSLRGTPRRPGESRMSSKQRERSTDVIDVTATEVPAEDSRR